MRIKWKTFQDLKELFPAQRGESMADYFERLADYLYEIENGRDEQ